MVATYNVTPQIPLDSMSVRTILSMQCSVKPHWLSNYAMALNFAVTVDIANCKRVWFANESGLQQLALAIDLNACNYAYAICRYMQTLPYECSNSFLVVLGFLNSICRLCTGTLLLG